MPTRLSYEPSAQAVVADVLPSSARVVGGASHVRTRVSWPLMTRATGLGEIQGGEVVLVPPGRADSVLAHLDDLTAMGVAAVVLADDFRTEIPLEAAIPIVVVPASTDMRRLQEEMERYIMRRRRDLFELSQECHRSLVEGAIAGASVRDLLRLGAASARKPAFLDQDGDVLQEPPNESELSTELLSRVRIACGDAVSGCVQVQSDPPTLAVPVFAGKERRGIVGLLGVSDDSLDADEVVLTTLASACAIALAREPSARPPSVEDALSSGALQRDGASAGPASRELAWTVLAVRDAAIPVARLERALGSELTSRGVHHVLARQEEIAVAFTRAGAGVLWEVVAGALAQRLSSTTSEIGISRQHRGVEGARRAADEALEALRRGAGPGITRFETVEVQVLLASVPGWEDFVRGRLGPLLQANTGRQELLHTLAVYLATGRNGTEAARQLQVHRNTLLYRLRRLKDLLELDPDNPDDAFGLELAIRILKANGEPLSAAGDTG